jgi:hypothetical protein
MPVSLWMHYWSKTVDNEQLIVNSAKPQALVAIRSLFAFHYSLLL